jgi:hypothetical protein
MSTTHGWQNESVHVLFKNKYTKSVNEVHQFFVKKGNHSLLIHADHNSAGTSMQE